jgi:EmrB/QacA subfamily drug resistance transporter
MKVFMKNQYQYKWLGLVGICLLAFTAYLDATIVNTALPFIQSAFKANVLTLQWITNIFTIILSMTMIVVGKICDIFGKKKVFYVGIIIFAFAAFGAGLSPSIQLLIFFRGLQAVGASTVFIASSALLTDIFPQNERLTAISFFGGMTGFGLMIGPFLGGVLIQTLSWRWVFWINLPLIAIGLILCVFTLKNIMQEKHETKIDYVSLFLLVFGLGAFMYGLISLSESEWSSIPSYLIFSAGLCSLIALVIVDETKKNPLLDLHIFKEKLIILSALACSMGGVISTVFMFFDPLYLRQILQMSPLSIGIMTAIIPVGQALVSFVLNRLVKIFGVAQLLLASLALALASAMLHKFLGASSTMLFIALPFFLLGITWGLSNSLMITAVNQVISKNQIGAAIGTIATIWNIAGSVILAISAVIFHSIETKKNFLDGFYGAIEFNIVFAALIFFSGLYFFSKMKAKTKNP